MKYGNEDLVLKRKRLLFRSIHRGTKEMDILLGSYYKENMANFSDEQLDEFDSILEVPDHDLYAWVVESVAVPANARSAVLTNFIESVRRRGDDSFL